LTGSTSPKDRERIISALQDGGCKYLIATGQLIGEGFENLTHSRPWYPAGGFFIWRISAKIVRVNPFKKIFYARRNTLITLS